jgi:YihY family inner membrane protein
VTTLLTITRQEQLTLLAAAVAYYGIVSAVPLAALAVAVLSVVEPATVVAVVDTLTGGGLPPDAADAVRVTLESATTGRSTTLVGLVVLLWSGLRVFRALDRAFGRLYGTPPTTIREQLTTAVVVLATVGAAAVALVVVSTLLTVVGPVASVLGTLGLPVALAVVLLPLYLVVPNAAIEVREAIPGAIVAAAGWVLFGVGFRLYAALTSPDVYGVLGALLLAVTWLYVASFLVLLGAAVNATLAGTYNSAELDRENDDRAV